MTEFRCLTKQIYHYENYSLHPLREEDIYKIKDWRNNQLKVLRQSKVLNDEDQRRYYSNVIVPTFDHEAPQQILFSLVFNGKLIGYGGLVHIHWEDQRSEVSFLVDPDRVAIKSLYQNDFSGYLSLIKQVAFESLGFNRIYTETYDIRDFHISILEKNGFKEEGRLKEHVFIENVFVDSIFHGHLKKDYNVKR